MCLAIPGIIETIEDDFADVRIGGVSVKASLALVPEARVGDYVLVHTGYAIQVLSGDEAEETLSLLRQIEETPLSS